MSTKTPLRGPHTIPIPENLNDTIMERVYAKKYAMHYKKNFLYAAAVLVFVVLSGVFFYERHSTREHLVVLEFSYAAPDASEVRVTGDFSSWSDEGVRLKKQGNGKWSVRVKVPEGSYRYMFLVDGKTELDPSALRMKDPFGEETSVKTTDSGKEGI